MDSLQPLYEQCEGPRHQYCVKLGFMSLFVF